ncbi:MAG: lipoprotein-releasing ABC transporter permease subunit [Nitrospirota bacterium]
MNLPYEFFISLRYLRAQRRQKTISLNTFISIAGVTLGVAALIATLAVMTGFREDLQEKILGTNSHIVVADRVNETIRDYKMILSEIKKIPHVLHASPSIYKQVLLSTGSHAQGVVLKGVDPDLEGNVTDLGKNIVSGSLEFLKREILLSGIEEDSSRPRIIIGKELSARLGVFVGDKLNLISPTGTIGPLGIIPKIRQFIVVGLFESGMYEYDTSLAYISIKESQDFFNMGDEINRIEIKVDNIFMADRIAGDIEREVGIGYLVRDWMRLNRNIFSALKLEKIMMFIILILIILVASFNIISTLAMIVVEKGKEIAILKSMGAKNREIMKIFMINGLVIGIMGTIIGIPLGYGVCALLERFISLPGDIYYISHIPVRIRILDILLVSSSAIIISFLSTLYPSWQAAKLNPVDALRYE